MNFQPTTLNERIESLDILRGFSLLGILLVNMFAFYLPMPHILDLNSWFSEAKDIIWQQTLDIYVQSSFYPLFSMLFGYGLAMQFLKSQRTGTSFYKFAPKRLFILLVIGFLHAIFIWWGDILATYAFCGFFLLMLIRLRSRWLVSIAIGINFVMHFLFIFIFLISGMANMEVDSSFVDIEMINSAITAYGVGSWGDAFMQRLKDLSVQMSFSMWITSLFTILPYMLIGAAAAKLRLIERAKELKKWWITLAIICILAGLVIKSAPYNMTRSYLLDYLKVYIGGPVLSVGYVALIVLLCMIPWLLKLLRPIGKAGRMSLTLYIMQSIICTLLFYNFGFGLYGEVDVQMGVLIAIALYVIQVIFAELYFMKFKQGPLELVVKKITYRKMLSEK
ncbi:uncharacterized protein JOD29_001177 [Lysinibacillus composti]|uniref:DUF418 domain-containing protein n=1 Tax=Lysinibacillus composti TaxID=720633 RepID=A0A3N9UH33_9BACI|nr:DUF418 domain-containing protein [Lysinibacillus composti]MBM7607933.1 uncharacterized protein [Lysinibacillus composti]RQW75397.1 DUF418 domain-containing protein [Lysinibacillus composti]